MLAPNADIGTVELSESISGFSKSNSNECDSGILIDAINVYFINDLLNHEVP